MTALQDRIAAEIRAQGPMRLDRFWNLCLYDTQAGYYTTRDPFGSSGDFTTAPEISQMFGELVAAWLVAAWCALGAPSPFVLAEIGPGRGTLMADILRTVSRLDRNFMQAAKVRLVEASDRLAARQIERLAGFDLPLVRHRRVEELEALPLLLVANELFDAIAIRQLVFNGAWHERLIELSPDGALAFGLSEPLRAVPASLASLSRPQPNDIFEISPERDAVAARLADHIRQRSGAALLFDYGHLATGYGDTLQAMKLHQFADVLERPGEQDITSHVDFGRLAALFRSRGLPAVALGTQGELLLKLGLVERAGALGRQADAAGREALSAAVHRLAGNGPGEMGDLFKVCALASQPLPLPPFGPAIPLD